VVGRRGVLVGWWGWWR